MRASACQPVRANVALGHLGRVVGWPSCTASRARQPLTLVHSLEDGASLLDMEGLRPMGYEAASRGNIQVTPPELGLAENMQRLADLLARHRRAKAALTDAVHIFRTANQELYKDEDPEFSVELVDDGTDIEDSSVWEQAGPHDDDGHKVAELQGAVEQAAVRVAELEARLAAVQKVAEDGTRVQTDLLSMSGRLESIVIKQRLELEEQHREGERLQAKIARLEGEVQELRKNEVLFDFKDVSDPFERFRSLASQAWKFESMLAALVSTVRAARALAGSGDVVDSKKEGVKTMRVGMLVCRGSHWRSGEVDGGVGNLGRVVKCGRQYGRVTVSWPATQKVCVHKTTQGEPELREAPEWLVRMS